MFSLAIVVALSLYFVQTLGTISPASTLVCPVGRLNVPTNCTITVMSSLTQASTALPTDFTVDVNYALVTPYSPDGGAHLSFPTDTSSLGSYLIAVTISQIGSIITGGALTYTVFGVPSSDSYLVCPTARLGFTTTCTIYVLSGPSSATTALATDFQVQANGNSPTLTSFAGGSYFTFPIDTSALGTFPILVQLASDGSTITYGSIMYTVYGVPSIDSAVTCPTGRIGVPAYCSITVMANSYETTAALASDFAVRVAGAPVALNTTDGTVFTFPVCTSNIGSFAIAATLANGRTLNGGSLFYTVFGMPGAASTLTCSPGRYGLPATCTINVRGSSGAPTTGFSSDFNVIVAGLPVTLTSVGGGAQFTFPANTFILGGYTIVVTLVSTGSPITNGLISYTVYGNPTPASKLNCDASAQINGPAISCLLSVMNGGGTTTCPASDLSFFFGGLQALPALTTTNAGFSYSFSVPVPPNIRNTFNISVAFPSFSVSTTLPIFGADNGVAAPNSLFACTPSLPRLGDTAACTFVALNSNGQYTSVLPSDLSVLTSGAFRRRSTGSPTTVDGGTTYTFTIALPNYPVNNFVISVLAKGSTIVSSAFRVSGTPTAASTLSCVGANHASELTIGEEVTCTILVQGSVGPTTAYISDFAAFTNVGPLVPFNGSTPNYGSTIVFTFPVPLVVNDSIEISSALATAPNVSFATLTFPIQFQCGSHCILPCLGENVCNNCSFGYNGTNCEAVINDCEINNGGCVGVCVFDAPGMSHCDLMVTSGPAANTASSLATGVGVGVALLVVAVVIVIFVVVRNRRPTRRPNRNRGTGPAYATSEFDAGMFTSIEQHLRTGSYSAGSKPIGDTYNEAAWPAFQQASFRRSMRGSGHPGKELYHEPSVGEMSDNPLHQAYGRSNPLFVNAGYDDVNGFSLEHEAEGLYDEPLKLVNGSAEPANPYAYADNVNDGGYLLTAGVTDGEGYLAIEGVGESLIADNQEIYDNATNQDYNESIAVDDQPIYDNQANTTEYLYTPDEYGNDVPTTEYHHASFVVPEEQPVYGNESYADEYRQDTFVVPEEQPVYGNESLADEIHQGAFVIPEEQPVYGNESYADAHQDAFVVPEEQALYGNDFPLSNASYESSDDAPSRPPKVSVFLKEEDLPPARPSKHTIQIADDEADSAPARPPKSIEIDTDYDLRAQLPPKPASLVSQQLTYHDEQDFVFQYE